ncbi:succinate--CoA ligase [ADP-forming] subunit beta [Enterococcus florum]|uniref:Succinate--CoA ligase [ADP-forming] subunit beta n=1 Tax=Enterococcus florum TaxID=2480627 RepID=A0A4P5P8Q1_9ENTE|nr:ATP-grasp domain-containing protein [Enterococcus florum]GCF94240.1 succinate--CoA ligase [ADP-forming] subunit beta [Enterococcus florum]
MDYLEIEGKAQLERFGIPINESILLTEDSDLSKVPYPCVLKGQILSGKRGKAGAVRVVKNEKELLETKKIIEAIEINGQVMEGVIACGFLPIEEEYYLGMTLDVTNRAMTMLFTPYGGMDIEELAATAPEKLLRFDCTAGFDPEAFRKAAAVFDLPIHRMNQVAEIAEKLSMACFELDATTIEINPLALLKDDTLVAIDAKLVIDDNSLYRQGDYTLLPRTAQEQSAQEIEAQTHDLTYIEVDPEGDIGTMAGGAGIGMATMDTIFHYGGRVNNFLDLGGGVTAEKTYQAMRILLQNERTSYILVNIFGGINNCADMAEGITRAYKELGIPKTVVIKSRGFNQEQGWDMYQALGFPQTKYGTTDEAVQTLLKAKEGR